MIKTKTLSIMFTDMKGFTVRTSTHSRKQLQHLLELQDEVIKPAIKHYDGNIVKTIGDAFMVSFESPTDAVLCGMKIQENVLNHNVRAPSSDQIEVRIAINTGEVNIKDNDVFGEPVNVASRIEAIAEPNEVYFTESVYLSMNKNEIPTAKVGYRKLKGIPEEIKVYKVVSEKTTLIRAKMKREKMAAATANLAKDQVHSAEEKQTQVEVKAEESQAPEPTKEDTPSQSASILEDSTFATAKEEQKFDAKSFWQKHKKKFLIVFIVFLVLVIISLANEKRQLEREKNWEALEPEVQDQLRRDIERFPEEFNHAVERRDVEHVNNMLDEIFMASKNAPPELVEPMTHFVNEQLKNPELTPRQKDQLRKVKNNLKTVK